jgi:Tol biopolymer transport system component
MVKTFALVLATAAAVVPASAAGKVAAKPIVFHGSNSERLYTVVPGAAPKLLTRGRLHGVDARWSADHRLLTFSGWTHDPSSGFFGTCIFVMRADGRFLRRVTPEVNNVFDRAPDWSPDGKQIVFARDSEPTSAAADIYVVSARGGTPRLLRTDGSFPRWSPDGQTIAFTNIAPRAIYGGIYLMASDGSAVRRLTSIWNNGLDWSPDGRRLLFSSENQILSIKLAGGAPTPLGHGARPVYSPDGRQILFVRYGTHPPRLYLANTRGLHVRRWPLPGSPDYPDW